MTDRVHPAAKPSANGAAVGGSVGGGGGATNPAFPATKAQLYGATRPPYRPTPRRHRYRRSRCCSCCIWTTVTILILIFLVAVAGVVVYFLYRPQRPNFTVSSLKVATFNLTSSSTVAAAINIDVTAKNPNKNLVYYYGPISVSVATDDGVAVGDGSVPGFTHRTKNTTLLKFAIRSGGGSGGSELDDAAASKLRSQLRSKGGVPLKIELETKVKAKMGALKTPKIRIRVTCQGIKAAPPSGKTPSTASTADAKCKVDWRVKIWKWTF